MSFVINKLWSNGTTTVETKTVDGLIPASANTLSLTVEGVTNSTTVTAPPAPVAPEATVTSAVAEYISKITIAENSETNNYKVLHNVTVTLSDGTVKKFTNLEVTFPFNKGKTSESRNFTRTLSINGKDYAVSYTLTIS